jgi:MoaA/NifB/PqqE/SkfB family radical SAM enzyme
MNSRFRNLKLFSLVDSLRLAVRVPRCAFGVIRDSLAGFETCPFPRRIGLFLTDRCNFACPMCAVIDARNERGGEMPFEVVERVYRESAEYGPIIDLIGGEPLLYRQIADTFRLVAKTRVVSVLTTNGMLLSDYADAIVESRLPILQVSLDGWDEQSQRLRGNVKRSFERIADGIAAVRRAKGGRAFPLIRILTAVTRNNYAHLDRIQQVVHSFRVKYWGVANYFFVTQSAMRAHRIFALRQGLNGAVAADAIEGDVYLTHEQVQDLKASLERVRAQNLSLRLRINYNWDADLDRYYSPEMPSRRSRCDLPYSRLDVHSDGGIAICVSGKTLGQVQNETLRELWGGRQIARYREMYENAKPMPMCFRCCGLSNSVRFDV